MKLFSKNILMFMSNFVVARSFLLQTGSQMKSLSSKRGCGRTTRSAGESLLARHLSGENSAETSTDIEQYKNENNIRDQVFSALSEDGSVKVTACTARNLVNDLMIAHTMTAVPADALGRTVVCALLMSNGIQAEQTVQLTINGNTNMRLSYGFQKFLYLIHLVAI
jgi:hypothetical protein